MYSDEISQSSAFASALTLWLGEAFVGVAPLLCHVVIHRFTELPGHLARCHQDSPGHFMDCHPVADGLAAEVCILAVVLSGLALLPLSHRRAVGSNTWRQLFRFVVAMEVGTVMVMAAMFYVLVTAGISRDIDVVIWGILGGALGGSLLLTMERAFDGR